MNDYNVPPIELLFTIYMRYFYMLFFKRNLLKIYTFIYVEYRVH